MKLAVVGSRLIPDTPAVRDWLQGRLRDLTRDIRGNGQHEHVSAIVSGGARGFDSIAREVADTMGLDVYEILPGSRLWAAPNGFRDRNMKIVDYSDGLIYVGHWNAKTYGSGWTRDYARWKRIPTWSYWYDERGEIVGDPHFTPRSLTDARKRMDEEMERINRAKEKAKTKSA